MMSESNASQPVASAPRVGPLTLVAVVMIAIVFLLLATEAVVRVREAIKYGSADRIEDAWTFDPRFGLRIPVANYSNGRISVNSLGFRGPEIAVPKPPHTLRIAYLGASTTWCGEGSGNDRVWPHLVTASLSEAFPGTRFDYINAGVPGYTMPSILANLQKRVAPLQPDVIVIYEAANMLSGEMRERAEEAGLIKDRDVEVSSFLSQYSLLWYLVEKNLRLKAAQRNAESHHLLDVDVNSLGSDYRKTLTDVVVAAQQDAKLVAVATFAIQPRAGQTAEQQKHASESALFYMPFVTPKTIIDVYARYNQIIREVARETGAFLIEGETDIPGDPVNFTDSVHFTDAGSAAMARRIGTALIARPALRELAVAASR